VYTCRQVSALLQATKALRESRSIALPCFQTSVLEGGDRSASRPGRFLPRERPGTHCTGDWMGLRAGLNRCGKSRPYRDSIPGPSSPQPVAISTDLPGHRLMYITAKIRLNFVQFLVLYIYIYRCIIFIVTPFESSHLYTVCVIIYTHAWISVRIFMNSSSLHDKPL
jgi:hypothetical protein